MAPQILRTRSRTSRVKSAIAVVFSVAFFLLIDFFSLAPSLLLGNSSSSVIQKVLLLVFKSFYASQVEEDNPMACVSSKLFCALSLGNVCLYLFE